ncbi:MAG: PrsW family intramembrane metalloprotease [Anaerolineales bacterium]|nr:PrsW family intramembrane metalloprotease [Anaerolineales bacterium]
MTISTKERAFKKLDWMMITQAGISLIFLLVLTSSLPLLSLTGLIELFSPSTDSPILIIHMGVWVFSFIELLILPSFLFSLSRLLGLNFSPSDKLISVIRLIIPWTILLAFFVIFAIYILPNSPTWISIFRPPLFVLGAILPVIWTIWIIQRKLPALSIHKTVGTLFTGFFGSTIPSIFLEIVVLFMLAILFVLIFSNQLLNGFQYLEQTDLDSLTQTLVSNPVVIVASISFFSLLVPLIEELFKPLAVWLLLGRNISPVEGFLVGGISGASFSLFETLNQGFSGQDALYNSLIIRIGTTFMHILTASITGWAIASSWKNRKYLKLALAFFVSMALHGLWNGMTVMMALDILQEGVITNLSPVFSIDWLLISPIFLVLFSFGAFFLLFCSHKLIKCRADHQKATDHFLVD